MIVGCHLAWDSTECTVPRVYSCPSLWGTCRSLLGLPEHITTDLSGLTSGILFSHNYGGQKSKMEVLVGSLSLRPLSLACRELCPCIVPPCAPLSPLKRTPVRLGPTLMTSFYLNLLFKGPIFKYSLILRSWGSEFNI